MTQQVLDCLGQQCPQPILHTAKAARALKGTGGGTLEISADDDAFPLDIRSWCRSSGSELIDVTTGSDGVHRARVRVVGSRPASAPPSAVPEASRSTEQLDCRGMQCPQPILEVARKARALGHGSFEVLADDPAFRLDLQSWSRSAGSQVEWLESSGSVLKARVDLRGKTSEPATQSSQAVAPVAAPPQPISSSGTAPGLDLSLNGLTNEQGLQRLDAIAPSLTNGESLRVRCEDTDFSTDLVRWAAQSGLRIVSLDTRDTLVLDLLATEETNSSTALVSQRVGEGVEVIRAENRCTLLVLHNDKEALLAALLVAVGAAAQGMEVMIFFTFWGLNLLRGDTPNLSAPKEKVSWMQRMMKWMMPKGPKRQKLGQMDMGGMGRGMLKSIMNSYNIMDVPELMDAAEEQGCRFVACTMSMQVMGITKRDLAPRSTLEFGGVAAFVESAGRSNLSLMF